MILFFMVGLLFIGLGIFAKVHSKRMYKLGLKSAMVLDCQPKMKTIGTKEVPCSEVTLEFYTGQGTIQKTIIDNGKYFVGDTISIYYDPDKDRVELPKNISEQDSKGPYMVMAFGFMISALCVLVAVSKYSAPVRGIFYTGLAYFVAVGLILGGLFLAVIRPMRRKRAMPDCRKVPGKLVDYRTHRSSSNYRVGSIYVYEPVYEFYYNGEMIRIEGEMSSSGSRFRQIGKDVTIVINEMTGEKYCLDDVTSIKKSAVLCLIFGVIFLVVLISTGFDGSGGNNAGSKNSAIQLEFEPGKEYSTESVEMPDDEWYSEYCYVSVETEESFSYIVRIYQYGIGIITISPNESMGKSLDQTFSFYLTYEDLKPIVQDAEEYDFSTLAGQVEDGEDAMPYEYVYCYKGEERIGSGGRGVEEKLFYDVANNIKAAVPQVVWDAIDAEIEQYYE